MSRPDSQAGIHGLWLPLATLTLLGLLLGLYVRAEKRIDHAYDQRQSALALLDQLRQSSDELTRMARTYVATGDANYQKHFLSILAVRSGRSPAPVNSSYSYWDQAPTRGQGPALPLLERMRQAGITPEELQPLALAQSHSETLTQLEWAAMALVAHAGQTGAATQAQAQATRMLHDDFYNRAKAAIMHPIQETYQAVERRTAAQIEAAKRKAWTFLAVFVTGVLSGLNLVWWAYRRGLRALIQQRRAEAERVAGEQSRVEQALSQATDLLNHTNEIAKIGGWELDLASQELTWSAGTYRIHELEPGTPVTLDQAIQFYTPEARSIISAAVQTALATGTPFDLDLAMVTAKGRPFWARAQGTAILQNGTPCKIVGAFQDITERKQTELARQHIETIMESLPGYAFIKDRDLNYVSANRTFCAMLHIPYGQIQGKSDYDLFPADLAAKYIADDRQVLATGEPLVVEETTTDLNRANSRLTVVTRKQPWLDEHGAISGIYGLGFDVTELKNTQAALEESRKLYRNLIESTSDLITRVDLDGCFKFVNHASIDFFGLPPAACIGRSAFDFIVPEDRAAATEAFTAWLAMDTSRLQVENRLLGCDGQVHAMAWLVTAERDEHGKITGFASTGRDISERQQAEGERRSLQLQLQQSQKLESLGNLAGGIAHDMNNVLGAILGLASAHSPAQPEGSPVRQAFETIITAADRGGKLVKGLLSFARQSPAECRELDMNALLLEEVHLLEHTTLAKIRLVTDFGSGLRPMLGDASTLTHAFMNLCVNAVDAMAGNGTLTLRTRNVETLESLAGDGPREPGWIEIVVEDTGSGMTQAVLDKAMDPFFTTKPVGKGTGLGLSMVYSTVKAHHGQIELASEPGQGSRVTMRFPSCVSCSQAPIPAPAPQPGAASPALNILAVDDDELIQASMQTLLQIMGHNVTIAACGEQALFLLESGLCPDLVILDMNMPGLGGAGTLPRLRALQPTLPVLLATGRADQAALDLAQAHPDVTLLSKPFAMTDLLSHLQNLAAKRPHLPESRP